MRNILSVKFETAACCSLESARFPTVSAKMLAESDIRDLGGHSEVLVDAFMNLYYAGKLTNNKTRDKGLSVYTAAVGSKALYDFIDDNPICCCAPVDYVNNVHTISEIDNFISINSCIGLDLFGQVCSESAGYRQVSGTGGQLDFVLALTFPRAERALSAVPPPSRQRTDS